MKDMHLFRNKEGDPILTSRPEKYRNNPDYKEIAIKSAPMSSSNLSRSTSYAASGMSSLISQSAEANKVDANLICAIIQEGSGFDAFSATEDGRCGVMQLKPDVAAEMGVKNLYDPAQNIAGGTKYLAKLLSIFKNDQKLAIAAYKLGPETVKKAGAVPKGAKDYVKKVLEYRAQFSKMDVKK